MADNTLSGLIVTIYSALNTIAREQIGFIPAVRKFAFPGRKVAQNEPITFPIVPAFAEPTDVSASNVIADPAGIVVANDTMTMANVKQISWGWNGEEATGLGNSGIFATTQEDAFKQAFRAHTNQIEAGLAGLYKYASRAQGAVGTIPFNTVDNLTDLSETRRILEDNGMWFDGKMKMVLSNRAMSNLRGKQTVVFKANEAGTREMQLTGVVTQLEGWNLHQSGQIASHTKGAGTGYVSDGGEPLGETTVKVKTGSGTIVAGDVILNEHDTDNLYVVNSNLSGANFSIGKPGLLVALPDGDDITLKNSYIANMAFNEDALVLISALPNLPEGGDQAVARTTVQDPISGLLFEVSEYKGYRKVIYVVAAAWGVKCIKTEGVALLLQ